MVKRTCTSCDGVFQVQAGLPGRPRRKCYVCSPAGKGGRPRVGHLVETWSCARCGKECQRPRTKGQRPKWCSDACGQKVRDARVGTCLHCGIEFSGFGDKFCSIACVGKRNTAAAARRPARKPSMTPDELSAYYRSQWGPLRTAIEERDPALLVRALRGKTKRTPDGCWEWSGGLDKSGYPRHKVAGRSILVHRVVLEVMQGKPLGVQHSHHICANTRCVRPDHLQPATHNENIAEMKARQSYVARIAELEAALRELAPDHPALNFLPFFEEAS